MNYAKKNMNVKLFISFGLMFFLACGTPEQKETKPSVEPVNIKGRIQIDEIKYSGPPKESWIVTGIRDTVTNDLAKVREVEAISIDDQNKALKMIAERRKAGEKNLDPSKESAKILAADYLCVGNLQNTGKVLRLNIRLLKAPDFSAEQTATIDGTLDEIFTLQDKVVESLLANVDAKMSSEERLTIEVFTPKNEKAYELMARGNALRFSDPQEAIKLTLQALELEPEYLDAIDRAGVLYYNLRQNEKSFYYHSKRKKILEDKKLSNHYGYAVTLNNIGLVYSSQEKYTEALNSYLSSKKIEEEWGRTKTLGYAMTINNIGANYHHQNNYLKAVEFYSEAQRILKELSLTGGFQYATILHNLYTSYWYLTSDDITKWEECLDFYIEEIGLLKELGLFEKRADISYYYDILEFADYAFARNEDWERRMNFFIKAKYRLEEKKFSGTIFYAKTIKDLSSSYKKSQRYEEALELLLQSKKIQENLKITKGNGYRDTLFDIGSVYVKSEEYCKANQFFIKARKVNDGAIIDEDEKEAKAKCK